MRSLRRHAWLLAAVVATGCRPPSEPELAAATPPVETAKPTPDASEPTPTPTPSPEPAPEPTPSPEPEPTPSPEPTPDLSDPFSKGGPSAAPAKKPEIRDLPLLLIGEAGKAGPKVEVANLSKILPKRARQQLDEEGVTTVDSTALDADGSLFVVQLRYGAVQSVVVVVDASGKPLHSVRLDQRTPWVGLADVVGDARNEVFVEVIEGTAMSSFPRTWKIFRVTPRGRLVQVASFAKAYDYGSRRMSTYFANQVTMPDKGVLLVETLDFVERGPEPPPRSPRGLGERYELRWNPTKRVFQRKKLEPRAAEAKQ